jgi:flagellar hook-length control protein FliK
MLKISDNQATAVFTSPHSAVREAVENAMPKLREILADNGIALGNTTVSDQPQRDGNANAFSNQHSRQQNGHWSAQTTGHSTISALPIMQVNTLQKHNGMVDTFA